jgi:quercetin dioxygenase-like cupin family protein
MTVAETETIRYGAGGGVYRVVATPAGTGNTHYAFEATEPPGGGPPLHIHGREEEFFLVLEGEISFYVGGEVLRRGPGGSAFVPRGTPHCFKNTSDRTARLLVLFTPGDIEGFFEFGAPIDGRPPTDEEILARMERLGPKFGLQVLGPSPL